MKKIWNAHAPFVGSFEVDHATVEQISLHLHLCDQSYIPHLSDSVEIGVYAAKIVENSRRFEAWANGKLVGLVAMYCNDKTRQTAFVTNVSVLLDMRGRMLALNLMEQAMQYAHALKFKSIELDVGINNNSAINLYKKLGFRAQTQNEKLIRMCQHIQLPHDGNSKSLLLDNSNKK
jgi:ribosomal protein S18 acetylase RimI-like enzyme